MLAAKASLAVRVDALGEDNNTELGIEHRAKLERRLRALEGEKVCISSLEITILWLKKIQRSFICIGLCVLFGMNKLKDSRNVVLPMMELFYTESDDETQFVTTSEAMEFFAVVLCTFHAVGRIKWCLSY